MTDQEIFVVTIFSKPYNNKNETNKTFSTFMFAGFNFCQCVLSMKIKHNEIIISTKISQSTVYIYIYLHIYALF